MLREMALRDMNRPSVGFHGLANESTGLDERREALTTLHQIDRAIDGTRLTGRSYGWQPTDETSTGLDVAGLTLYYGVFYGEDPRADRRRPSTRPPRPPGEAHRGPGIRAMGGDSHLGDRAARAL